MLRVDFHAHLWSRPDAEEAMAATAQRHGVPLVCVSALDSYTPDRDEIERLNARTEAAIQHWPLPVGAPFMAPPASGAVNRAPTTAYIGFATINPLHGEAALGDIGRAVATGVRGIKLWVACPADDPAVEPVAERAIELGWPVLQHAWHKWTGNLPGESDPVQVARLATRFPELKLVMAHVGGDWEYGLRAVRRCDNVWVDTSGSIADAGMIEACVRAVGAERVVWGTDMPGADLLYTLTKIEGAAISDDAKERILSRNALELLGLEDWG